MQTTFYRVGGYVRDKLLGLQSKDVDFSVESESFDSMREAILARGGTIWKEDPQFFTIRAKVPELGDADFVLCRKDGAYSDGRRPDSVEPGTLLDDLARRDFTINAIAETESGEIIDPFNGRFDIRAQQIRCVGETERRMEEDSLRMMRALRFSVTKGFVIGLELEKFLLHKENAALLRHVSIERIREEIKKCFDCNTLATLAVLRKFDHISTEIFSRNLKLVPTIVAK